MNRGTWKLTIGGSDFGDYTDIIVPDGISGGPNVRPFEGYGAVAPVFVNLGNDQIVRAFTMTRDHASDTAANSWYAEAIQNWAGVANVVMTHMDYEGVEATWTVNGARVEIEVAPPIGLATITKIKITGGPAT